MRLSRLAAIAALGLGLVLLTYLSVATADVLAQTPTAATPGTPRPGTPGTPAATPRPVTPTVAAPAAATPSPTRAVTPVTPTRAPSPSPVPTRVGGFGSGGAADSGLDGQYVTALWVVGWGLVTLGSLFLVLRRRRA